MQTFFSSANVCFLVAIYQQVKTHILRKPSPFSRSRSFDMNIIQRNYWLDVFTAVNLGALVLILAGSGMRGETGSYLFIYVGFTILSVTFISSVIMYCGNYTQCEFDWNTSLKLVRLLMEIATGFATVAPFSSTFGYIAVCLVLMCGCFYVCFKLAEAKVKADRYNFPV